MRNLSSLANDLSTKSRERHLPLASGIVWPERLPDGAWQFSPELTSLYGTEAYDALSEAERRTLSFFEAVNFFSINVHGEKMLIEGLARRMHEPRNETISPYLHHFVDEENKHMFYFAEFCRRYAGKIYPERKFAIPRIYAPGEEDFLFHAKAMVFEEVVNAYNVRMARDARLSPIVRQINRLHHLDESRHLAFGRILVKGLFEKHAPSWPAETCTGIRRYLGAYLTALRGECANPDVYADAGLHEAIALREAALSSPKQQALWNDVTYPCRRYLVAHGMLDAEARP